MTFDELKEKILQRGTELIAQGVSTEQLAYLMKGLEVLESIREKDAVADAIAQIGDIQSKYLEAKDLLNQVLQTKSIVQLGKPAVRLFGTTGAWGTKLPFGNVDFSNADITSKISYTQLSEIKQQIKNTALSLQFGPRNSFSFNSHYISNAGANYEICWSFYILKNGSDEDKTVELNVRLSSFNNSVPAYAWVISNGVVLLSRTNNTWNSHSLNLTIPAGEGSVVYIQNGAWDWGTIGSTNVHILINIHDVSFYLPEGVEWDYEAYKQLVED